jgi:glycerol-3-phosphate dehydrogenase
MPPHPGPLVNAAGPWVAQVADSVIRANERVTVRLVQGSHIVVPRLYDHPGCYIFQNPDGRIFFLIPYESDFTLIGTTDRDFSGDPANVRASPEEIDYLCRASSAYLRTPVTPDMVVWSYSGVRPLFDDKSSASKVTRDYVLKLDAPPQAPPLLSILGGKITTYRRLAEAALGLLQPFLPATTGCAPGWTGREALPGGDFPVDGLTTQLTDAVRQYPFMPEPTLHRLLRTYGTRLHDILAGATCRDDLGRVLGADLTEAELRYLVHTEWARSANDVVWRRTKLGLRLSPAELAAIDELICRILQEGPK